METNETITILIAYDHELKCWTLDYESRPYRSLYQQPFETKEQAEKYLRDLLIHWYEEDRPCDFCGMFGDACLCD